MSSVWLVSITPKSVGSASREYVIEDVEFEDSCPGSTRPLHLSEQGAVDLAVGCFIAANFTIHAERGERQ